MWTSLAVCALLAVALLVPLISAVIPPGFDEESLRVPSSIFNFEIKACEDFIYLIRTYDCTDIHSKNPAIQVSLALTESERSESY